MATPYVDLVSGTFSSVQGLDLLYRSRTRRHSRGVSLNLSRRTLPDILHQSTTRKYGVRSMKFPLVNASTILLPSLKPHSAALANWSSLYRRRSPSSAWSTHHHQKRCTLPIASTLDTPNTEATSKMPGSLLSLAGEAILATVYRSCRTVPICVFISPSSQNRQLLPTSKLQRYHNGLANTRGLNRRTAHVSFCPWCRR